MLTSQTKLTSSNDGGDRIHRIESKARLKYLRMKSSNDNENARLKLECEKIDRKILSEFERFLRDTTHLSDVHGSYVRTTGWYDDAVRPRKREARKLEATFKKDLNKWNYFANGTIDMWARHPLTLMRQNRAYERRPTTALVTRAVSREADTLRKRPFTAAPAGDGSRDPEVKEPDSRPKTAATSALQRQMSLRQRQMRSRSAHPRLQRFRSPRLDSDSRLRSAHARDVMSPEPDAPVTHDGTSTAVSLKAPTVDALQQLNEERDDVFEAKNSIVKSFTRFNLKEHDQKETQPRRVSINSQKQNSKPKLVSFTRQSSKSSKTSRKSKTQKAKGRKVVTSDSDDEDVNEKPQLVEALNVREEYRMPRMYVRPQDRYKSADLSLMRRHAQLQRPLSDSITRRSKHFVTGSKRS